MSGTSTGTSPSPVRFGSSGPARPDLKIIVMSATLDAGALRDYLAPCEVLVSEGRMFPVRIEYLPKPVNFEADPAWDVAARECERVAASTPGDMLVFMPGAYEIGRTIQAIQGMRAPARVRRHPAPRRASPRGPGPRGVAR